MISTIIDNPVQEYRVLLPSELSMVVTKRPLPPLDRLVPIEETIKLCASHQKIVTGTRYNCLTGTVRSDNLPKIPHLPTFDIRSRYGGYDSSDPAGRRTCNWVRFLKVSYVYNDDVNIVGFRFGPNGDVIFEIIRDIPVGSELIAFLIPDTASHEDSILVPALQLLRSSFYRKAIDDAPLDLSRSLLSTTKWGVDNSRSRSPSPIVRRNQCSSSDADDTHSEVSPPSSPISVTSLSPPPHSSGFLSPTNSFVQFGGFTFSRPIISPSEFNFAGILPVRIPNIPSPPSSASTSPKSPLSTSPVRNAQSLPAPTKRRERTMLPCDECGKAFDRPSLLKRHMRTHTGEKPHVCDVCSRAFSTSSSLNTHRRIHSGEKPHSCPVCGKRFTASSNLYYHKMTHVKEKPHKCGLCTRSFPTPGDLRSHMFVHNGQWPHKCNVCGKGFSKNTNLRNHLFHHTANATKSKL